MKIRSVRFVVFVFIFVLSASVVTPFFFMGKSEGGRLWYEGSKDISESPNQTAQSGLRMPITHDMQLHFDQMRSFYAGLSAGVLYPRWQEDTNRGFGAPTMNYYSPGVYYLTSACFWLMQNWYRALWIAHLMLMLASGLAFFLYARRIIALPPALLATVFYILAPYHLVDQYQRGAIAELLTFVWMPLVLYFIDRLFFVAPVETVSLKGDSAQASPFSTFARTKHNFWNIAGLAVSYSALLWSHIPTAYQFSLTLAFFLPLLAILRKDLQGLLLSGLSLLLGTALSAAYLYPAISEQHFIHSDILNGFYIYEQSYLFIPNFIPSGASHDFIELLNQIWLLNVLVFSLGTLVFLKLRRSNKGFVHEKARVLSWAVAGLFSSFMMLSASDLIRKIIPKLEIGVFSWRFLTISSLIAALLFGVGIQVMSDAFSLNKSKLRFVKPIAVILLLGITGFSVAQVILPMRTFQIFTPEKEHLNDIMVPANVTVKTSELPLMQWAGLVRQKGKIIIDKWQPQSRKMTVTLPADDQLIVRTFNFPGWKASVDGKQTEIENYPDLGAMVIALTAGSHTIELEFLNTPARQLGNLITLTAFVIVLGLITFAALKKRRMSVKQPQPHTDPSEIQVELAN